MSSELAVRRDTTAHPSQRTMAGELNALKMLSTASIDIYDEVKVCFQLRQLPKEVERIDTYTIEESSKISSVYDYVAIIAFHFITNERNS